MSDNRRSLDELMREEEERLDAQANTPERIAADREIFERNAERMRAELDRLERQGMIDHGGEEDDDEEGDEA